MADQIPDFIDGDTNISNRVKAAWLNDVNKTTYRTAVNVRHSTFGAVGDGTTNDTVALQAAIDTAKADGRSIYLPNGTYAYTALDLSDIPDGLAFIGESDPSGASIGDCSALRCTASGAGTGITINSSYGISFDKIALSYNSVSYTGNLVSLDHSAAATDPAFITFERCVFTGEGSADNAAALLKFNKTIITRVHKCTFKFADKGITTGTGYFNAATIQDCTFQALTVANIKFDGTGLCQGITLIGNTFENLVNGQCAGFDAGVTAFIEGLHIIGNWFGDVTVNGGLFWIRAKALGMSVSGNFIGTAGGGATDYAIHLDGCQGVSITGNRFDAKAVNIATACTGVVICGNDISVGATGINVAAGGQPTVFGNTGFTDTYGGAVRIGGVATPQVQFNPSSGATKNAQIQQSADVLNFNDNGVATRMKLDIPTGNLSLLTGSFATKVPRTGTGATDTITFADTSFIANVGSTMTLTLESAATALGKILFIKTIQAQTVVSASSNVIPRAGGAAGTAILPATDGAWVMLHSNGTDWEIMAGTP